MQRRCHWAHRACCTTDMLRPQPIPACILAGFCESEWSDGVCPSYASADVKFFVRERRPIPLTQSVLNATAKSGVLVDAAGGELVVLDCVQKGDLLSTTWAALCAVANFDGSAITYRAVRGSLLDQLASKARIDMAVYGEGDSALARSHSYGLGLRASAYVPKSSGDGKLLHDYAMRS